MIFPIAATIATIQNLNRVCPRCKRSQVVAMSLRFCEVGCRFCQARIPAAKKSHAR